MTRKVNLFEFIMAGLRSHTASIKDAVTNISTVEETVTKHTKDIADVNKRIDDLPTGGGKTIYFPTFAAMSSYADFADGDIAITTGFYSAKDGGGCTYIIYSTVETDYYAIRHTLSSGKIAQVFEPTRIIDVKKLGSIGDGADHPLSEKFTTLDEAKKIYPTATSLDDSINLVAMQFALTFYYDLFIPEKSEFRINYQLRISGRSIYGGSQLTSKITCVASSCAVLYINSGDNVTIKNVTLGFSAMRTSGASNAKGAVLYFGASTSGFVCEQVTLSNGYDAIYSDSVRDLKHFLLESVTLKNYYDAGIVLFNDNTHLSDLRINSLILDTYQTGTTYGVRVSSSDVYLHGFTVVDEAPTKVIAIAGNPTSNFTTNALPTTTEQTDIIKMINELKAEITALKTP